MKRILNFFKSNIVILFLIILVIVLLIFCNRSDISSCCLPEIIQGIFILLAAVATTIFAISTYQSEQRTLRLQKVYFEDALLGQVKSLEEMMSQTNKNFLLTENLYNLILCILSRQKVKIDTIKNDLIAIFESTSLNIGLDIYTTDFKKETISKLLHDSGVKGNSLPNWIAKFENDTYRFSAFLQSQIQILKTAANRLTESNKDNYLKVIREVFGNDVPENYLLIKRHYILFNLLSDIVLEFSSEQYTTFEKIAEAFEKEKIKRIVKLLNISFKDVIADFSSIDIGKMEKEDAIRLDERINCANKIIRIALDNNLI